MTQTRPWLHTLLAAAAACAIATLAACGSDGTPATPPEPVELVFAHDPQVAFKGDGEVVVAYQETTERGNAQRDRLRIAGTFFETGAATVGVVSSTRRPNGNHALGTDASGTLLSVHAAGVEETGFPSPGFIACRRIAAANDWQCQQAISGREWLATVAMAGSGIGLALVSWSRDDELNPRFLQSTRHSPESGWTPVRDMAEILAGDTHDSDPAVAFGAGLRGYALYLDPQKRLMVHRYDGLFDRWEGTPLSLAEPFADSPAASARLVLHRDAPDAAAMALYIDPEPRGGPRIRAWIASADGRGWRATPDVPGSDCAATIGAAMAASGDVLAVWRCDDAGHADAGRVFANRYSGGSWAATAEEIGAGAAARAPVKVAVDALGNGVAVWRTSTELVANSLSLTRGWLGAQVLGNITLPFGRSDYAVAMDSRGRGSAVWVRDVDPNATLGSRSQGTRVVQQEVGPFALSLTAQRHTFGGEPIPLTVRLGSPAPAGGALVSLQMTLPSGTQEAGSVFFSEGQSEASFSRTTSAVADFTNGRVEATYGGLRSSQPITLMPEPTGVALSVAPTAVLGGQTATLSVAIEPAYPVGLEVQLESSSAVAPLPARVSTPGSATLQVPTATTTTSHAVLFTARVRGRTGSAVLQVDPTALGESVLTLFASGLGSVSSTPAGITNCTVQTCTASYPIGTPVTLTATPLAGSNGQFFAWEGEPDCNDGRLDMLVARSCTAFFAVRPAPYAVGTGWSTLGTPFVGRNTVNPTPALALNGNTPVVAYVSTFTSPAGVPQLSVVHLQATTFSPIGVQGNLNVDPAQAASEPAIVTSPYGAPHVAWVEGSGAQRNLYVSRLAGSRNWVTSGPLNYAAGSHASSPSIALDEHLRPMVVWVEDGTVKFKRFDGSAWVSAAGGEGPASAGADRVRLASGGDVFIGTPASPVIVWTQGEGMTRALKVVRDYGFTPLGTQVNPASLRALTEFGVIWEDSGAIVTWGDGDSPFTIRSQRWNGSAWVNVAGNPVMNNNPNRLVAVAMSRNSLDVAYVWASIPVDSSNLGVSNKRPGNDWLLSAPDYADTRDANVGPTALELAGGGAPIVVRVSRNGLGEYVWWVLHYQRP